MFLLFLRSCQINQLFSLGVTRLHLAQSLDFSLQFGDHLVMFMPHSPLLLLHFFQLVSYLHQFSFFQFDLVAQFFHLFIF